MLPGFCPVASLKMSPNGSGPVSGCFSMRSKSSLYKPGFNISPVVSPNTSLLMPIPFVIHAGLLLSPFLLEPELSSVVRSSNLRSHSFFCVS